MSENLQNANTVESEEAEQTVLPSDVSEQEAEVNPYDLSSFKDEDGKLAGKFDTAEDLMKSYNEAQEYIQKINAEKAKAGNEKAQADREAEQQVGLKQIEEKMNAELVNGSLSEETLAAAKEAGFSDEKIELTRYKVQESMNKIVENVGSMETFNHMKETLANSLPDAEKAEFNSMINTSAGSEIALLGLKAKYEALTGSRVEQDRIRGKQTAPSSKGYSSQQEMMSDLAALRRDPNNKALQAAYEAKKRLTPDSVFYGT